MSCVMTCLLRKQTGQDMMNFILHGLDNQPDTKNHLSIGALSVERPMLLKWSWTGT